MNRKRVIAVAILIVAAGFFVYAFVGISVPSDEWNSWAAYKIPATFAGYPTYALNSGVNKPIFFNAAITFTASGSLSVNNPITVHALFFSINDTTFSQDYVGVGFSGCYPLKDSFGSNGVLDSCVLPLVKSSNGQFTADGTENWLQSGPSYLYLIPGTQGFVLNNEDKLGQYEQIAITVNPVADTLSTSFNLNTLRLTYILVGFSVLMLQPVLEVILTSPEKPRGARSTPPQSPEPSSQIPPTPPALSKGQMNRKEKRRLKFLRGKENNSHQESDRERPKTEG